jgi:hypothetical protein
MRSALQVAWLQLHRMMAQHAYGLPALDNTCWRHPRPPQPQALHCCLLVDRVLHWAAKMALWAYCRWSPAVAILVSSAVMPHRLQPLLHIQPSAGPLCTAHINRKLPSSKRPCWHQ